MPGSQIDIKPIIDYDSYVGKTMEFKVVKINETIKNAVVSHKALIESDLAEQREAIISSLEKGQVLEGLVKNITDFGAFMDLGGVDGLLYITDISWGRINHPNEILELNQKINVVVLDFDENKKRISLGLKQLQPHPWDVSLGVSRHFPGNAGARSGLCRRLGCRNGHECGHERWWGVYRGARNRRGPRLSPRRTGRHAESGGTGHQSDHARPETGPGGSIVGNS